MPVSTLRAWVLGIFWAILIPGMNQFFYFRYPSVAIGSVSGEVVCTFILWLRGAAVGGSAPRVSCRPGLGASYTCKDDLRHRT